MGKIMESFLLCFLGRERLENIVRDKMIIKTFGKCIGIKDMKDE